MLFVSYVQSIEQKKGLTHETLKCERISLSLMCANTEQFTYRRRKVYECVTGRNEMSERYVLELYSNSFALIIYKEKKLKMKLLMIILV